MKNVRTKTIFYLDLKHVHKYGSAKFDRNPIFSSQQMATESAESVAEQKKSNKKKKKKVGKPIGDPVGGRDAPSAQKKNLQLNQDAMPNKCLTKHLLRLLYWTQPCTVCQIFKALVLYIKSFFIHELFISLKRFTTVYNMYKRILMFTIGHKHFVLWIKWVAAIFVPWN